MRRAVLLTIMSAIYCCGQQPQAPRSQATFKPLAGGFFIVTKNHYAEGFAGTTARFGDVILIGFVDRAEPSGGVDGAPDPGRAADYYEKKYFQAGREFKAYRGGALVGSTRVEEVLPLQCDSSTAVASLAGFKLEDDQFAIASNASVKPHDSWQSKPTSDETKVFNKWMTSYLLKKGRPGSTEILNILKTAFWPNGPKSLVVDVSIKRKDELRSIFVVGQVIARRFIPNLIRDHRTRDVEDAKDFEPEQYVDQVDLDGDGRDEVIVEQRGYESEQFLVYRLTGKVWKRVWMGGQGGC